MGEHIAGAAVNADGAAVAGSDTHDEFLSRIGHMTRTLHDSLRGLGLDKLIEKAASDIPDARDRLDYVARMSEQAAQKVLNATDAASPLQDRIDSNAQELSAAWNGLLDAPDTSDAQWRELAERTMMTPGRHARRHGRHQGLPDGHHDGPGFPGPDRPGDHQGDRDRPEPRAAAGADAGRFRAGRSQARATTTAC